MMKHVILTCILLGSTSVALAQRLFPFADTSGLSVNESLRQAFDGDVGGEEGGYLVLRAGYYGNGSDRDALRRFVSAYQEGRDEYGGYAKLALESLWELGESQEYFMDLASRWDQDTGSYSLDSIPRLRGPHFWIAFYAMRILAREPTPDVLSSLQDISHETSSGHLDGNFLIARNMALDLERYERTEFVAERIAWAMKWASYGGGPLAGNHFSTNSFLHPKGGVGRHWLEELAQRYPQQVAQAIRGLDIDIEGEEVYQFEEEEWYLRRHLAALTNNEVRAMLANCLSDEARFQGCPP